MKIMLYALAELITVIAALHWLNVDDYKHAVVAAVVSTCFMFERMHAELLRKIDEKSKQ